MTAPDLMTITEAAEAARISPRTLQTALADGTGPATIRLGRRLVRIRRDDLATWIEAHRTGGDAA